MQEKYIKDLKNLFSYIMDSTYNITHEETDKYRLILDIVGIKIFKLLNLIDTK